MKVIVIIALFVSNILLYQKNNDNVNYKHYIVIVDCFNNKRLFIRGYLCNDTIFYFDKESKESIKETKGLENGSIFLYDEKNVFISKTPIIGPYQQDRSILLRRDIIRCDFAGQIYLNQFEDYFILRKPQINTNETTILNP